jgi:hypothetical protein
MRDLLGVHTHQAGHEIGAFLEILAAIDKLANRRSSALHRRVLVDDDASTG